MARRFIYSVQATVWDSEGSGRVWSGDVLIDERADSDVGYGKLVAATRGLAEPWLRRQHGKTPSGKLDMTKWGPKAGR